MMENVPRREGRLLTCAGIGMILFPLGGLAVAAHLVAPALYVAVSLLALVLVVGALSTLEPPFAGRR